MKKKWNWLDTLIVVLVIGIIAAGCVFFLRPKGTVLQQNENVDFLLTVEAKRAAAGSYESLKAGDEIFLVGQSERFGVIETVEEMPHKSSSFNEETKQLEIAENEKYPVCRVTIKTSGYMNDSGEVYAHGTRLLINDNISLETNTFRLGGIVYGVKGVGNK